MKRHIIVIAAFALLSSIASFGQNLNPQVQVTNDYKAELGKSGKQSVALEIPDSLTSFRTSVSYNVFETPYMGSYEFVPYEINVTPQKPASDYSKFYIRAGAGYPLRPELKLVWTPMRALSGNTLAIFQDFNGYLGNYGTIDSRGDYSGFDFSEKFGIDGRWFSNNFSLFYGLDYQGIFTEDFIGKESFNDFTLRTKLLSDPNAKIVFDAELNVNQAFDAALSHTGINLQGGFFPNWMLPFDLRVDFSIDSDFYSAVYDNIFVAQIAPKALFDWDAVQLQAGVNFSPASDIQWIYPDVDLTIDLFGDAFQFYAKAKGGKYATSYTDLKLQDHWFNAAYTTKLLPTLERLNASIGFRGSILKYVQFDLRGGWASYSDAPMTSLVESVYNSSLFESGIAYASYNAWYADADIHWKAPRFAADLSVGFKHTDMELNDKYLDLPLLSGNLKAVYNWNSRIFAGISCKGMTERDALTHPVPGFLDLGLVGEYLFNKRFGAWANVGNLLGQDITVSPLHVQKGIYCTAGISLNLR